MADAGNVRVRFSVVSFSPRGTRVLVVGSCPELGGWRVDGAPAMRGRLGDGRLLSEPDFYWVDVDLGRGGRAEYKFVEVDGEGVRWEQLADGGNRVLQLDEGPSPDEAVGPLLLPVERFAGGSESDHTGRFYSGVKERQEISVRKVLGQMFLGSCPRKRSHIDYLKSLGITVVVNFQTEEDCRKNCVTGIGMEEDALAVSREYESRGMEYIWMPTFDMSTDGRAQMLPQGSHIFASLVQRGHVIYSHCNAGVGRSVAAVCGYLTFALGLSPRRMQHVVAMARPVSFFDFEALDRARPHYEAMFGKARTEGVPAEAALLAEANLLLEMA